MNRERVRSGLALAVTLVALCVVFGRGLGHQATTVDDEAIVFRNPVQARFGLRELRDALDPRASRLPFGLQYTPLRDLSHALDHRLFGGDPRPHHLQSILLHALATTALFVLLRRLDAPPLAAAAGALVFALHPLQVESVTWISGRNVPLAGAFLLWAMVAWRRARTASSRTAWVAALLLIVLANLSKQSAVVAVVLLAAVEWAAMGARGAGKTSRTLRAYAPLAVVTLAFTALGLWVGQREGIIAPPPRTAGEQLRLSFAAAGWYAEKLLWPAGLLPAYDLEPPGAWGHRGVLAGIGALAAAVLAMAFGRSRARLAAAGAVIILAALAPGAHGLGTQVVADRYAYVALAGVALVIAAAVTGAARRAPRLAAAGVATTALLLGATAHERAGDWRNDVTLFGDAVAKAPENPLWHHLLGRALADAGRTQEGETAMRHARALHGGQPVDGFCPLPPVLAELGLQREREGDHEAAEEAFVAGLEQARAGEVDRAAVDLGAFYLRRGDPERARLAYLRAVERDPDGARWSRARIAWLEGRAADPPRGPRAACCP